MNAKKTLLAGLLGVGLLGAGVAEARPHWFPLPPPPPRPDVVMRGAFHGWSHRGPYHRGWARPGRAYFEWSYESPRWGRVGDYCPPEPYYGTRVWVPGHYGRWGGWVPGHWVLR